MYLLFTKFHQDQLIINFNALNTGYKTDVHPDSPLFINVIFIFSYPLKWITMKKLEALIKYTDRTTSVFMQLDTR